MSETHTMPVFTPEEQEMLRQAVDVICAVVQQHGVEVVQIYLFGSRARGEATKESDWDFYVIADGQLDRWRQREIVTEAKRVLARLRIPNDIILDNRGRFQRFRPYVGHLAHEVQKEGVRIL